jgi:putative ABC transport system permease protein
VDEQQRGADCSRDGVAQRLHVGVGSTVELETGGTTRTLKVAAIYRADGQHLGARVPFVLPSGLISDQPSTWYGGAHIDPKQVAAMERAFFAAYPTITVINVADVLERIENVVDQITFVVRLLAGFSILAGLTILASSIASTRFRRMQEAVVLKTLGATRMRIVRTFSVEFSVLGLLAGAVGVVFANLLTRVLLHRLDMGFQIEWGATARPRLWEPLCWPRPPDGSQATAFSGCGRSKCCARNRGALDRNFG